MADLTVTVYIDSFLQSANAAGARGILELGSLATQSGTFSGNSSGNNTGDQDLSGLVPKTTTVNGQPLSGNVTVTTITGNAGTATALQTARNINGVPFNGTVDISVPSTPAGSSGQVQYNNAGVMAGNAGFTVDPTTGVETHTLSALGTTPTAGSNLINSTPAAAGAQQIAPGYLLQGQGWKTNATAASQPVAFMTYLVPVQGATAPTANYVLSSQINGGAWTTAFTFTSAGALQFGSSGAQVIYVTSNRLSLRGTGVQIEGTSGASGGPLLFVSRGGIYPTADGAFSFRNAADSANGAIVASTVTVDKVITPAGTTGAQTINAQAGTVNFAAGATTLVVTNSLVTANSIVIATLRTNDGSFTSVKNVVSAAGSFTIRANAAATAETSVGFFVLP